MQVTIEDLQREFLATHDIPNGFTLPCAMLSQLRMRILSAHADGLDKGWKNAVRLVLSMVREEMTSGAVIDPHFWYRNLEEKLRDL